MAKLLSLGLNILADIFYPKYCFSCRRPGAYLCRFCINQVPILGQAFCVVCNSPGPNGFTHQACRSEFAPDRLLSALPYQNSVVSDMVITGKYYFIPEVFAILGALAAQTLMDSYQEINPEDMHGFVLCPIPLHRKRQRWRGFNQAEVAGRVYAQGLQIRFAPILTRSKNTKTQKDLNAEARKANVQNAFFCQYRPPEKVLLFDDVCTTGQTFLEATRALKQNGAKIVWCISIAKD